MTIIKCKMCGGDMELSADKTLGTCEFCGSQMTLPRVDSEQRAAAFNRGNHFRRIGEFDKALAVYESIVREDDTDAEAHWCCALCRFGIEYVEDPNTYEYLPTCHRASFDSFLEDVDYLAAVEHSEGLARRQYQRDAARIAEVQRGILATSQNEEPFDVFICYKESDENGQRTRDSMMAQDIYYQLTEQGLRVFFARITLEDKVGSQYEPYIFAALNSAKVMVVVGTSADHLNAVWVKNEWSRFLIMMKRDHSRVLLPCYRDMDPYDMPEQLSVLQSYDMSKIGFIQDLVRGIRKVVAVEEAPRAAETVVVQQTAAPSVEPLLKRAYMFLEDGDWRSASEYCEKVLDVDPENARAYLVKLLARYQVNEYEELLEYCRPFDQDTEYQKALRFADEDLAQKLRNLAMESKLRTACLLLDGAKSPEEWQAAEEEFRLISGYRDTDDKVQFGLLEGNKVVYDTACQMLTRANSVEQCNCVAEAFRAISGYEDADEMVEKCLLKGNEVVYMQAYELFEAADSCYECEAAADIFREVSGYKDADVMVEKCLLKCKEINYQNATSYMKNAKTPVALKEAANRFRKLQGYRDADEMAAQCVTAAKRKVARKNGLIIGICVVIALLIAFVVLWNAVLVPNQKYDKATRMMQQGMYREAIFTFREIAGHRDSVEQIKACETAIDDQKYDAAFALMSDGKYDEAIEAFQQLNGYRDSEEQIRSCETAILDGRYNAALALKEAGQYDQAAAAFMMLDEYRDSEEQMLSILDLKYDAAVALKDEGKYTEAIAAFRNLGGHRDSVNQITICGGLILDEKYDAAMQLMEAGQYEEAIGAFSVLGGHRDSNAQIGACKTAILDGKYQEALTFKEEGRYIESAQAFLALEDYRDSKEQAFAVWDSIAVRDVVGCGQAHTVGLKADGTVIAIGSNKSTQCDVSDWHDIVAISAGYGHTVGLKKDGTVVATGYNKHKQCVVENWRNIVAIGTCYNHTVGLMADGRVVAAGLNSSKQCEVDDWENIVAISTGKFHTVGLKVDGTVVSVGGNSRKQRNTGEWSNIIAISAGYEHTVGLKANGTVVAVGNNGHEQCNTGGWMDIVAISAGDYHTVGLKADGTVVAVGRNNYKQCNVGNWTDIVAISAGESCTVGLKADGTVVATGRDLVEKLNVSTWRLALRQRPTLGK